MKSQRRRKILMSIACIVPFCIAMSLRDVLNIWISTTAAACVAIPLSLVEARRASVRWWKPPPLPHLGFGVAVGVGMSLATWLLYPLAISLIPALATEVSWLYDMLRQPPGPLLASPLLLAVVAAEELVWRGILMDWLIPRFGKPAAIVMSALLYILPQIAFRSLTLVAVAFGCGLIWGSMRTITRNLWPPFIAHLVWDILVFIVYPVS